MACEIQPLNNLRTQRVLAQTLGAAQDALSSWQLHWCEVGFDALEKQLAHEAGRFCHGDTPTMADCFVVPQVYNSQRPVVGADLRKWPTLERVYRTCLEHPAFDRALPRNQPGFTPPTGH